MALLEQKETLAERLRYTYGQLQDVRVTHEDTWRQIAEVMAPYVYRDRTEDTDLGKRKDQAIIDNIALLARRTHAAGIMTSTTNQSTPWFNLTLPDEDLASYRGVKTWLEAVRDKILRVFAKSNTYHGLHRIYDERATFGTAGAVVEPNYDNVIHWHNVSPGRFYIATDHLGRVNTMYREVYMTVAQMVRRFGIERLSESIRNTDTRNNKYRRVLVIHAIEPRDEYDSSRPRTSDNMRWRSCYFDPADVTDGGGARLLEESGYNYFPVIAPRFDVYGDDTYGFGSGHMVIGDTRGLQHAHKRKGQVIDYKTLPPTQAPHSVRQKGVNQLPGGVTYTDPTAATAGIRPLWEVNQSITELLEDIQDIRRRINQAFFVDLFTPLAGLSDTTQRTRAEVLQRHSESLVMLGPSTEALFGEVLRPLVDMTFSRLSDAGALPPWPTELNGMELQVEFVSVLSAAQKAVGANALDRFALALSGLSQLNSDVLDKANFDRWVDSYADATGVPAQILVPDDEVADLRASREQARAAQAQIMAMREQAATVRDLAAAPTGTSENALTDTAKLYSAPGGA